VASDPRGFIDVIDIPFRGIVRGRMSVRSSCALPVDAVTALDVPPARLDERRGCFVGMMVSCFAAGVEDTVLADLWDIAEDGFCTGAMDEDGLADSVEWPRGGGTSLRAVPGRTDGLAADGLATPASAAASASV
jgi:hypothetical protein